MTAVLEPSYRKRPAYHGALLGSLGLFASVALMMGYVGTKERIAAELLNDTKASLAQVIPASLHDNDLTEDTQQITQGDRSVVVYRARKGDTVVAVAFEVVGLGYAGPIVAVLGIDREGTVLGARVISHQETPGLGDKIEEKKDDWILQFAGLSFSSLAPEKWVVKKDGGPFDQFTGATITPRALLQAIKEGIVFFHAHRETLLAYSPPVGDADPDSPSDLAVVPDESTP